MPPPIGNRLCWIGYILLAASSGGPFWGYAYLAAPVACALACWQRRKASCSGALATYDHTSWIIHTFVLMLLLHLIGLIALVSLFYTIGNDEATMARLTAMEQTFSSGTLSQQERIDLLFGMESLQLLFGGALLWWFLLVWPLKRVVHGMLSLWKDSVPQLPACPRRLCAFGIALAFQLVLFFFLFL